MMAVWIHQVWDDRSTLCQQTTLSSAKQLLPPYHVPSGQQPFAIMVLYVIVTLSICIFIFWIFSANMFHNYSILIPWQNLWGKKLWGQNDISFRQICHCFIPVCQQIAMHYLLCSLDIEIKHMIIYPLDYYAK